MREVLAVPAYRKLFGAQVVALLGTGLLTVALGLLAFDLSGSEAGAVLGAALAIKMVAYVAVAPLMAALVGHLPRRTVLIGADLLRACVALCLPLVTEAWQIYPLILVLQAASATFTPAFQAVIPEILPDERRYTRALSLSRLAYDLEALVSPVLAAALLTVLRYHDLFIGTIIGFLASACLVAATRLPARTVPAPSPFLDRLTRGTRRFLAAPELRGLLAINLVVACASAMVIVNTVVLVQAGLGRGEGDTALLLAAYGAGSMLVALAAPRLLDRVADRRMMLLGAAMLPAGLLLAAGAMALPTASAWPALLGVWALLGAATSAVLTPSSRLLRRASDESSGPAVFAAQFSLSHACFLLSYPLAGFAGAALGLAPTALLLAAIAAIAATAAALLWRRATTPVPTA